MYVKVASDDDAITHASREESIGEPYRYLDLSITRGTQTSIISPTKLYFLPIINMILITELWGYPHRCNGLFHWTKIYLLIIQSEYRLSGLMFRPHEHRVSNFYEGDVAISTHGYVEYRPV